LNECGEINQCASVKERRMLGVKLSAEPKTVYPNNHKMPNVSDFNVFSCHFEYGKSRHLWFSVFY